MSTVRFLFVVAILVVCPAAAQAKNVYEILENEQQKVNGSIGGTENKFFLLKNSTDKTANEKKEIQIKSISLNGKADFQTAKGRDTSFDFGFELSSNIYCVKIVDNLDFCPSLKFPISFKANDAQTFWKIGAHLRGYQDINLDYLIPFITIGTGYVDANNAEPSIYGMAGGGVSIPIFFIDALKNNSALELEYQHFRASDNIYISHTDKKPFDNQILYSFKFNWK